MKNIEDINLERCFTVRDLYKSFNPDFFDSDYCRKWVLNRVHPGGARCPACGSDLTPISETSFYNGKKVICRHCKKRFTALTGTFLSGTHLSFKELVLIMLLFRFHVETTEVMSFVRLSRDTINQYRKKFEELQDLRDGY